MGRKKVSQATLDRMVKGAAKAVETGKVRKIMGGQLSKNVVQKIKQQIAANGRTIQSVPIDIIDIGANIRKTYSEEKLDQLANSLSQDGLIQFPTLGLKKVSGDYKLICRNGHRRILAAKKLGWSKVDCVILPFSSIREELYHSINANIREDMFYLDLADTYQDAADLGESDSGIAKRVGLNSRTIGWYRRLASISGKCRALIRQHPDVFNATWAVNLARRGPIPDAQKLEKLMRDRIARKDVAERGPSKSVAHRRRKDDTIAQLRRQFHTRGGKDRSRWAFGFLKDLSQAGLISEKALQKIEKEVFSALFSEALSSSSRRSTGRSRKLS